MIDEHGAKEMRTKFEDFCWAWGIELKTEEEGHRIQMLQNYYLDVIASELMKINTPKNIVIPQAPRRN